MNQSIPQGLPEGHYAIAKEDKKKIRELGKKIETFLAQELSNGDQPFKIVIGAFQYVIDNQNTRIDRAGEMYMKTRKMIETAGIQIEEAFQDQTPAESAKQQADYLPEGDPKKKQLEAEAKKGENKGQEQK